MRSDSHCEQWTRAKKKHKCLHFFCCVDCVDTIAVFSFCPVPRLCCHLFFQTNDHRPNTNANECERPKRNKKIEFSTFPEGVFDIHSGSARLAHVGNCLCAQCTLAHAMVLGSSFSRSQSVVCRHSATTMREQWNMECRIFSLCSGILLLFPNAHRPQHKSITSAQLSAHLIGPLISSRCPQKSTRTSDTCNNKK